MAARLSRDDVLELIANDSDSGSEFEVSNDESSDSDSIQDDDSGTDTEPEPVVPQRGRGRARTRATNPRGRGRGGSVRGRGGARRARQARETPPEFQWRPVDFQDDFDLGWVGEPRRTGVLIDTSSFEPVEYFKLYFPDEVFDTMSSQTNLYSRQFLGDKTFGTWSRFHKWTDSTSQEMKAYLALQIAMGLNARPEIPEYWSTYWLTSVKFSDVMSRNRYQLLCTFLHFNDNEQRRARGEEGYDPLFKVRTLLDIIDPTYTTAYTPEKELSIDESMIKFKGRIFCRQYLPAKPTKWGIKTFALCESNTGYALRFMIYTGRNTFNCDRASEFSITEQVCLEMTSGYENRGYTLYMDNYYSSPRLFQELKTRGIGACGTVKANRKYLPFDITPQVLNLQKGDDPVFRRCQDLITCGMMDTKRVHFLSSVHSDNTYVKEVRDRKEPTGKRNVIRPTMCGSYNDHMNGVDVLDQKLGSYSYPHKSSKWYMTIYHRLCEVALVNAYILYCKSVDKPVSTVSFRERVIDGLLEGWDLGASKRGRPSITEKPDRLTGRHFPAQYTDSKHRPQCVVCSDASNKKRVQTRFYCRNCEKPMCPTECFMLYHTVKDFRAAALRSSAV